MSIPTLPSPRRSITEDEYLAELLELEREIHDAIFVFHTAEGINRLALNDPKILGVLNEEPLFWQAFRSNGQTALFMSLGRIFDSAPEAHSVHKVISSTIEHFNVVSKEALKARRMRGQNTEPEWLHDLVDTAWAPEGPADLRFLKKAVKPYSKLVEDVYRPIRNSVCGHRLMTNTEAGMALFPQTNRAAVSETLDFLHTLINSILNLYNNGAKPDRENETEPDLKKVDHSHSNEHICDGARKFLRKLVVSMPDEPSPHDSKALLEIKKLEAEIAKLQAETAVSKRKWWMQGPYVQGLGAFCQAGALIGFTVWGVVSAYRTNFFEIKRAQAQIDTANAEDKRAKAEIAARATQAQAAILAQELGQIQSFKSTQQQTLARLSADKAGLLNKLNQAAEISRVQKAPSTEELTSLEGQLRDLSEKLKEATKPKPWRIDDLVMVSFRDADTSQPIQMTLVTVQTDFPMPFQQSLQPNLSGIAQYRISFLDLTKQSISVRFSAPGYLDKEVSMQNGTESLSVDLKPTGQPHTLAPPILQ